MSAPRTIHALEGLRLEPNNIGTAKPEFRWVDPAILLVDETYQRALSRKSVDLIEKIVAGWDWARFKPPVVAETAEGLEVIDGQHTAIAAVSHPGIDEIPIMVVGAAEIADRARAFVGHNRDRLQLGQVQIHYANVAAGDEDAITIQQVCARAGVTLLRYPPGNAIWKPGESLAIAAIAALINRRGAMGARVVLQTLVEAHSAPVRAAQIKAVDEILHGDEYRGQVQSADLASALMLSGVELEREAAVFAATHRLTQAKALVVVLFRKCSRGRRRAG